jgi:hypothetical protein
MSAEQMKGEKNIIEGRGADGITPFLFREGM